MARHQIRIARSKETVEDLLRLVHGWNGAALIVVGQGARSSRFTNTTIGRKDQRCEPCFIAERACRKLVNRHSVAQEFIVQIRSRQKCVRSVMTTHAASIGMG